MKTRIPLITLFFFAGIRFGFGQQAFQNLDFESATVGQGPSVEPISSALPGWSGFLGSSTTTVVLHNDLSTGAASIDLL
ncbi:MAG TPA: hypothetical protein VHB20_09635, partial [Verrucomicrobiae bacterium]|nr:hypothetical protein [Verrucomicrobiae bacterium]